jgi:hypothetical protein
LGDHGEGEGEKCGVWGKEEVNVRGFDMGRGFRNGIMREKDMRKRNAKNVLDSNYEWFMFFWDNVQGEGVLGGFPP